MKVFSGQLTVHKLLKVVDEELAQWRTLWSLQCVEQLLDFVGDPTVDWNTYKMSLKGAKRKTLGEINMARKRWGEEIQRHEKEEWKTDVMEHVGERRV